MQRPSDGLVTTPRFPQRRNGSLSGVLVLALAGALLGACRGSSSSPAASKRDWTKSPAVATVSGATEIYAVGDLHGDINAAGRLLSAAGLISSTTPFHWTGGTKILVVLGDVIDKGSTGLPVIDLLTTIETEAAAAGGKVIVTLGNHEAEFLADPSDSKSLVFQTELMTRGLDPERVAAGEGPYGAWLVSRPLAASIDGWFFCHAGNTQNKSADDIATKYRTVVEDHLSGPGKVGFFDPDITGKYSLLEQSAWWQGGSAASTAVIDANLAALPAQHLVFGHEPGDIPFPDDPQGDRQKGELVQRYDGRIFMIDVGMSYAVGYSEGALLQIVRGSPDRTTVLNANATTRYLWP